MLCGMVATAVDQQRLWWQSSKGEGQGGTVGLGLQWLEQPVENCNTSRSYFTCTIDIKMHDRACAVLTSLDYMDAGAHTQQP